MSINAEKKKKKEFQVPAAMQTMMARNKKAAMEEENEAVPEPIEEAPKPVMKAVPAQDKTPVKDTKPAQEQAVKNVVNPPVEPVINTPVVPERAVEPTPKTVQSVVDTEPLPASKIMQQATPKNKKRGPKVEAYFIGSEKRPMPLVLNERDKRFMDFMTETYGRNTNFFVRAMIAQELQARKKEFEQYLAANGEAISGNTIVNI